MPNTSTTFCLHCGCYQPYKKVTARAENEIRNIRFSFVETLAFCSECGEEVYVPEVNDENVQSREDSYRKAANLITVEEIQKIITKYNIGAGPLAQIMGFGEITINRYLGGQLPSKINSEKLLEVLASHKKMEECLEANKTNITDVAYRKCRKTLDYFNELYGTGKIEVVTRYLLQKVSDITPLALQKMLYYAQAFFYALFGEELFGDACQAWAHGPVYPNVYYKYKAYGYNPIEQPVLEFEDDLTELTTREVELLDAIISAFGCYSGSILEKMTHSEKPWRDTRGNLLPGDRSVTEIKKETIHVYFQQVVENYNIVNPCDITKYSSAMRSLIS
ncbi:MAG: type II toxin-antitoxin system antitoxin SocA domain-containing protein [Butyricicoccus sp.]